MSKEYLSFVSEVQELEHLLEEIPEENVIERIGLQYRLESARKHLETISAQAVKKARLVFDGAPVLRGQGIAADFAGRAAAAFSNAFAAVTAGLGTVLSNHGPIPDYERNRLWITGTAIGSFGFEFEVPDAGPGLFPEMPEKYSTAMVQVIELFELSTRGSDDEVAEVVDGMQVRAVREVHKFLEELVKNDAWFSLKFGESNFKSSGSEEVKSAHDRLKEDNIQEKEEVLEGEFHGILPENRTFEFLDAGRNEIIRGKLGPGIKNPAQINKRLLYKKVRVKVQIIQVGEGRPHYTLQSVEE